MVTVFGRVKYHDKAVSDVSANDQLPPIPPGPSCYINVVEAKSKLIQKTALYSLSGFGWVNYFTLQGINISHLGKRKIIFKVPFLGDMLVSWRV